MTFGQAVARYRKERVLTQRNVADLMKLPLSAIVELERDVADPNTFDRLDELALLLGASPQELRGLAAKHAEDAAYRRKVEADEEFSMLAFRRSQE